MICFPWPPRIVTLAYLLVFIFTMVGCADRSSLNKMEPASVTAPPEPVQGWVSDARLSQCQDELSVLKTVNPAKYPAIHARFSRLMSAASQYAGVRAAVGGETRGAIDALYAYRVTLSCADISQALMNSLVEHGDVR